jgi:hypothetical protein
MDPSTQESHSRTCASQKHRKDLNFLNSRPNLNHLRSLRADCCTSVIVPKYDILSLVMAQLSRSSGLCETDTVDVAPRDNGLLTICGATDGMPGWGAQGQWPDMQLRPRCLISQAIWFERKFRRLSEIPVRLSRWVGFSVKGPIE